MYTTFAGDDITFYIGNRQLRIGIANADILDTPSGHLTLAVPNVGQVGPYGYLECVNRSPALSALAPGLLALVRRKA
jgi:hypothetical protein